MYYMYSFRSRAASIAFYEILTAACIAAKLINTPRCVSVGCGLSVKIAACDIESASKLFEKAKPDTFLGLFFYNGETVKRIEP